MRSSSWRLTVDELRPSSPCCVTGGTRARRCTPHRSCRYEVASALARSVAAGQLSADQVETAWDLIAAVPIELHELHDGPAVVAMTQRLDRTSAYDAAYIVLADRLGGELWTLDGPLARNAGGRGLRVRLIESS